MEIIRHAALVVGGAMVAHLSVPFASTIEMRTPKQIFFAIATCLVSFLALVRVAMLATGLDVADGVSVCSSFVSGALFGFAAQRTLARKYRSFRGGSGRSPTLGLPRGDSYIV